MNNLASPNQEVESWKDAFYNEFKGISPSALENYLEKEADQILIKHNIRFSSAKTIKAPALVSA